MWRSKAIAADRYDDEAIAPWTLRATLGVAPGDSARDIEAL